MTVEPESKADVSTDVAARNRKRTDAELPTPFLRAYHLSPTSFPLVSHLFPTCLLLVSRLFPYYCLLCPTCLPLFSACLPLIPHFASTPTFLPLPLLSQLSPTCLPVVVSHLSPHRKNCFHLSPNCFAHLFYRWKLLLDANYSRRNLTLESSHPGIRNSHACWVVKLD